MRLSIAVGPAAILLAAFLPTPTVVAAPEDVTAIEVVSSVPEARVFVDGNPEGAKLRTPIEVEPGSHEITVEAEGHAIYKRWVVAEAGRTVTVEVELLPLAPSSSDSSAEAKSAADDAKLRAAAQKQPEASWYERWWVWGALGVLAVGGVAFAIAASSGDDFVPGGELGRSSTRDWMSP